jgi:multidrug efflux pump subunit AcrA (membrane-fusion protein)
MQNPKKWIIIGIIAVVVIAVGAIGATRMKFSFGKQKKDEEVKQEIVRRGEFRVRVRESGNLRSFLEVDVRSNVEGEIVKILVDEGDEVELGDPLLRIDDKQILEQKKQAQAYLEARDAELKRAELQIEITEKQQDSNLAQALNSVLKAQATLDSFVATTQQRVTEAETLVATTLNSLNQDKIGLKQSEIALQQADLTLERAHTTVESAKISFETAELEHERNKELFDKQLISKQALEDSQRQLIVAESNYKTSKKYPLRQQNWSMSGTRNSSINNSFQNRRWKIHRDNSLSLNRITKPRKKRSNRNLKL